jgi:N-acetylglucosamine kinase-like BadF-type ATPase
VTRYYIGIEGFGIGYSVGVIADASGKIMSSVRELFHMSLHATEKQTLLNRLSTLLAKLLVKCNLGLDALADARVCISLTGVTYSYDRLVVLPGFVNELGLSIGELICTGDAEATLASHVARMSGSVLISHTGSTAYLAATKGDETHHYRFGGWGPAISDEGSGYWMGRAVLRHICEQQASKAGNSLLWEHVRRWLARPHPSRATWDQASGLWRKNLREFERQSKYGVTIDARTLIFHFTHALATEQDDLSRQTISGLTIPLMTAFAAGDDAAQTIVHSAADALADQLGRAYEVARKDIGVESVSPLVMYGGVLFHNRALRELISQRVRMRFGDSVEVLDADSPTKTMRTALGALLFALGNSRTNGLRLPKDTRVFQKLLAQVESERFNADLRND